MRTDWRVGFFIKTLKIRVVCCAQSTAGPDCGSCDSYLQTAGELFTLQDNILISGA